MMRNAIRATLVATLLCGCTTIPAQSAPADIPINGTRVFPESITSDAAGNLYNSSNDGTIYRTTAGGKTAEPWILPNAENGLTSVLGVFADDRHGTLWLCNNPPFGAPPRPGALSSIKAFDLKSGKLKATYPFPAGKPAACNDLAIATNGAVWAAETASGRIVTIAEGASALTVFAEGPELVGIDGIAFAGDGTLYINNVRSHLFQRVNRKADGSYAGVTTLTLNDKLNGPDGLRSVGGNKFLQAEGPGGRVALIEVSGDSATVTPLRTGLDSSPAVTRVGNVGYATEGKIGYLFDPALQGKDPGPFVIRAFALPDDL
jgi:sugar lactone lactonase YvrE